MSLDPCFSSAFVPVGIIKAFCAPIPRIGDPYTYQICGHRVTVRPKPALRHVFSHTGAVKFSNKTGPQCKAEGSGEKTAGEIDMDGVMQGPSQAPTQPGVTTAGLPEKEAALLDAAYESKVADIEAALSNGADVNAADVNGRTCLHFCAGNGLHLLVKDLVKRGAEINKQDVLGYTPLHMAAGYQRITSVQTLIDLGADANVTAYDGRLPVEIIERALERTPKKRFFMENPEYSKLKEMVDILDAATETEDEDEESTGGNGEIGAGEERVETLGDTKFVVRVQPKGQAPPQPSVTINEDDTDVTIRVIEPEKKE